MKNTIGSVEVYYAKCYRKEWGDVGIADLPIPKQPLEQMKIIAGDWLLDNHTGVSRSGEKPHTAQLIDHDDKVIAQFDVRQVVGVGLKSVEVPCREPGG